MLCSESPNIVDHYDIAVITRTKDRAFMLERAAKGLLGQSFRGFIWVIVNDGGAAGPVDSVAAEYHAAGMPVQVIHNEKNIGMEAASNKGIVSSKSKYIHIHDDDDTIESDFYEKMISRIEFTNSNGVVCNITHVVENVKDGNIERINYWEWDVGMPSISRMVCINRFVPIAFLYRRDVHEEIGYYNEGLRVCGDWEFYLRFLRRYDIDKRTEYMANYHLREISDDIAAMNSVKKKFDHEYHDMQIRNSLIRQELDKGEFGYAGLVTLGAQLWDTEVKLYNLDNKIRVKKKLKDRILNIIKIKR